MNQARIEPGEFTTTRFSSENRGEMKAILDRAISLAEQGRLPLRVPPLAKPQQNLRGMHYHYRPEVFFQLQGTTDFQFPRDKFTLSPDEIAVIPAGVPHGEFVHAEPARPFRNLVAGFYNNTVSLHLAYEARPGFPDIEVIEFFDAPNLDLFLTLTNSVAQTFHSHGPARTCVLKGLVLGLIGLLRNIIESGSGQLNCDGGKVFLAKCMVREQFANPDLGVQYIADQLGCSSDYLSHLFNQKTKERLTHYIQRIRIESGVSSLATGALNVSEVAYAAGFSDPAYFTRIFKQHKGMTPHEYRAWLDAQRSRAEAQPKTVFHDRLDFTHGKPKLQVSVA